jgi:hypothetical protein
MEKGAQTDVGYKDFRTRTGMIDRNGKPMKMG